LKIGLDSNVLIASVKKHAEPYHGPALELARRAFKEEISSVASALILIEVPGALASSTKMPVEKIYEVVASLYTNFNLRIMEYEPYANSATELMFEFRKLKSKYEIGSADFHHVATSIEESCDLFVTTDEKHLLRKECRDEFKKYIAISNPAEALRT
jgi:predicted nucleic acid-binding protein